MVEVKANPVGLGAGERIRTAGLPFTRSTASYTRRTRPIRSLDELAADTFESDEEVEEFLAFTYAERRRDLV